jgi:hypothetical protein
MPAKSSESDLRQKILDWYNGYTFDGQTRILNPMSILNFFENNKLAQYWLENAPSIELLSNIIGKNPFIFTKENLELVDSSYFGFASIDEVDPIPFLYQTGYLTIDKIVRRSYNKFYKLNPPNYEVNNRYFKVLIKSISNTLVEDYDKEYNNLLNALTSQDAQALTDIITVIYSKIPLFYY